VDPTGIEPGGGGAAGGEKARARRGRVAERSGVVLREHCANRSDVEMPAPTLRLSKRGEENAKATTRRLR
jgi:hypothetical protein